MEHKEFKYRDELEKIAPELSKVPKTNKFSVPENYFVELSDTVNEKITAEEKPQGIISAVFARYLSATVLSLLLLAVSFIYFNKKENINTATEVEISAEELIASPYLSSIDEHYIKESVAESDADLNNLYVDNADFEQYLLEQEIDETLINEL